MAKTSTNILEEGRRLGIARPSAGLEVPDGYFNDFCERMDAMLPPRPEIESPQAEADTAPRTFWQKVRPYVYMAAMFAGVWCMLQLFASLSGSARLEPMADNPLMAKALASDDFMQDYIYDDLNSWDILDEMIEDGTFDDVSSMEEIFVSDDTFHDFSDTDYILPQ